MAPEQSLGSVSKASDLYSLGVVAYELLTGARPFDGPDFLEPKLRKEFTAATKRNAALPAALDAFFSRALEPDPTQRFSSASEFGKAFAAALEGATSPS
jgi:serine/threonine-protein kinase